MSMRTIVNGFLATIGILVGFIFLTMNDHLKSIDEHLNSLDDKFEAVVELKGLLKNAPDLNQDIKVIGQETKGTHDDVVRLQERMELLEHFPEKILIQLENIQKQLRTTPGVGRHSAGRVMTNVVQSRRALG